MNIRRLDTGEEFADDAHVLISAKGNLSDPAWPEIPGLDTFGGEIMHSARWKEGCDFKNKNIGVIGNGSSAIQIVPQLQKIEGTQLSCFVRSKTWITNPFGDGKTCHLESTSPCIGCLTQVSSGHAKTRIGSAEP